MGRVRRRCHGSTDPKDAEAERTCQTEGQKDLGAAGWPVDAGEAVGYFRRVSEPALGFTGGLLSAKAGQLQIMLRLFQVGAQFPGNSGATP